ncbi:ornithine decarboxylase antizyme with +1 programmed ribosomal shift Spa1 [Phlyctochytrium bullatum]|nr:ornithine decarboxylase antizyme with +1 programmed ribosomal shift Spa1 [Phlyctochytrium bullatum]
MLGGGTNQPGQHDTNYVGAQSKTTPETSGWRGTINPIDIKCYEQVTANRNCTIEKGIHQGLAVIVKRSTNKDIIQREIEFLQRASTGEFIVAFSGWFEEEIQANFSVTGLVMQKCAMDLKGWLDMASSPRLADLDDKMLQISGDIAKGLAYINNLGIIHNDLKPQNVFVDKYHKPYIGDFGVATNRGEALVGYTEQYFDKESLEFIPDKLSDSWLLGATLWEFWSDELFNVNEEVYLDDIRNQTMKGILKKLLRPRKRRPSAKDILPLFDSTTMRTAYQTVLPVSANHQAVVLDQLRRSSDDTLQFRKMASNVPSPAVDHSKQFWDALATGNIAALRSFLSKGLVEVDKLKDGLTGLQYACRKNLVDVVKTLLEFGADAQKKDTSGNLPIQLSNSLDVWRALAIKMPSPQGDLFGVAERGDDVGARLILAAEKDPFGLLTQEKEKVIPGWTGTHTPVHVAAFHGHAVVCQVFLEAGANVQCKSSQGDTPLIAAAGGGQLITAQLLVEKGAEIEGRNQWKNTPLILAAKYGHLNVVQYLYLVGKGAEIEGRNEGKNTPLIIAAFKGHLNVVQYLVEKGAEIEGRNEGKNTPLILAALNGHLNVVQYLVGKGAEIEGRNEKKETPLTLAAWKGHLSVVQFLVKKGADACARNANGITARDLALHEKHSAVAAFLARP